MARTASSAPTELTYHIRNAETRWGWRLAHDLPSPFTSPSPSPSPAAIHTRTHHGHPQDLSSGYFPVPISLTLLQLLRGPPRSAVDLRQRREAHDFNLTSSAHTRDRLEQDCSPRLDCSKVSLLLDDRLPHAAVSIHLACVEHR